MSELVVPNHLCTIVSLCGLVTNDLWISNGLQTQGWGPLVYISYTIDCK